MSTDLTFTEALEVEEGRMLEILDKHDPDWWLKLLSEQDMVHLLRSGSADRENKIRWQKRRSLRAYQALVAGFGRAALDAKWAE